VRTDSNGNARRSRARKGVTLVEIIVATAIGAIVLLALGLMLLGPQTAWQRGGVLVDLQRDLSLAMDRMARMLREARWVSVTDGGAAVLFDTPPESSIPSGRIYRNGSTLVIETGTRVDQDVGNVAALSFTPYAGRVRIRLALARDGESVEGEQLVETRNLSKIGHWGLNEAAGPTTFDASGLGNNGALYHTSWTAGPEGGCALEFDSAAPCCVTVPDCPALDTGDSAVYEFCVRRTAGGSSWPTLYSRGERSNFTGFHWIYVNAESGRIAFQGSTGTHIRTVQSEGLTWDPNRWYRVVVVLDRFAADPTVSFWRDGEHAGTVDCPDYSPAASGDAYIGVLTGSTGPGSDMGWNGDVDEVIVGTF